MKIDTKQQFIMSTVARVNYSNYFCPDFFPKYPNFFENQPMDRISGVYCSAYGKEQDPEKHRGRAGCRLATNTNAKEMRVFVILMFAMSFFGKTHSSLGNL